MDINTIREVRKIVKEVGLDEIITTRDFDNDIVRRGYTSEEVLNTLLIGFHCTCEELNIDPKEYTSQYYACGEFVFKDILVGYVLKKDKTLILIHTGPPTRNQKLRIKELKKKAKQNS